MTTNDKQQRYELRFQPAARRSIAQRPPEPVAAAVLEFCDSALAVNPHRVGKPLFGPLLGCHGARRGTYRIVYRIDQEALVVHVLGRATTVFVLAPWGLLHRVACRIEFVHMPNRCLTAAGTEVEADVGVEFGDEEVGQLGVEFGVAGGLQAQLKHGQMAAAFAARASDELRRQRLYDRQIPNLKVRTRPG